jgi:hypothetical protein
LWTESFRILWLKLERAQLQLRETFRDFACAT